MKTVTGEEVYANCLEYFEGDELAAAVITNKYLLRDNDDNFIESHPNDMFKRLANEFARIESKYPNSIAKAEIYDAIADFKYIIPQGSPLAGIGNNHQTTSIGNCFVKGTHTVTNEGVKNIEDVQIGDFVPTHGGKWYPVTQLHKNKLNGRQLFDLKCRFTPNVTVTGNHKFLSLSKEQIKWGESPSWNKTQYLREGDYIAIPNCSVEKYNNNNIKLVDILSKDKFINHDYEYQLIEHDDTVQLTTFYSGYRKGKEYNSSKPHTLNINKNWSIDEDFAYFIGLWYGDGCIFSSDSKNKVTSKTRERKHTKSKYKLKGITFTFGLHEQKIIDFVVNYGSKLFGIKASVNENLEQNTVQIGFHSTVIALVFNKLFGRFSDGKSLWSECFKWDRNLVEKLLLGLIDSDGCVHKNGHIVIVLKNLGLLDSFYHLTRAHGIPCGLIRTTYAKLTIPKHLNIHLQSQKQYNDDRLVLDNSTYDTNKNIITINGITLVKIANKTKTTSTDEYVYTLGVDTFHSYAVEGLICQNCFVIGQPRDSYGGILRKDQELAQIMKRRGGVGIDISTIRPMGVPVGNSARTSNGIKAFMERYSNTTKEVAQNGRRGALMISIDCRHPDISEFIKIKQDKTKVTGANISIKWHDDFLEAVENDEEYTLRFPVDTEPNEAILSRKVKAKHIWNDFVDANWKSAEPGCLYWDTVLKQSTADCYKADGFETISTNPCGEITLNTYGACILMVLNLTGFVENPHTPEATFSVENFEKYTRMATRLIDDMIDLEMEKINTILEKIKNDNEPDCEKEIELSLWGEVLNTYEKGRRTGLGITGLGDTLAMLGYKYGSDESMTITKLIFKGLHDNCYDESAVLAEERGAFPIWDWEKEKNHFHIENLPIETQEKIKKFGRRNIAMNTCAPAGSISILAQTTSGIEPCFMRSYKRNRKINANETIKPDRVDHDGIAWTSYEIKHKGLEDYLKLNPGKTEKNSPYWGSIAEELNPTDRVKLQALIQNYIDHSISSTVNLPEDVSVDTINDLYLNAWKAGCKGITVYRDGSRDGVMQKKDTPRIKEVMCPKRPLTLECDIHYSNIKGKNWILFVGLLDGKPYDIFGGKRSNIEIPKKYKKGWIKKNGLNAQGHHTYDLYVGSLEDADEQIIVKDIVSEFSPDAGSYTLIISAMLRHGIPPWLTNELLQKVNPEAEMFSFEKSIARVLKKYVKDGVRSTNVCEKCKSKNMQYQDGCAVCLDCGYSGCN